MQTGGIFYFPWHRHQIEGTDGFYCLLRKTLAKWGKRNCQSSEAKSFLQWYSNPRPSGRQSNALTHSATAPTCLEERKAPAGGDNSEYDGCGKLQAVQEEPTTTLMMMRFGVMSKVMLWYARVHNFNVNFPVE